MKITVIACCNKMPDWVNSAIQEFRKRLQEFASVAIVEIPLIKRNKNCDYARILEKESMAMLAAIPPGAHVIALSIDGKTFTSERLAERMTVLKESTAQLTFLIGGPEGLAKRTLEHCHEQWSLSSLTLPHGLARVVLLEAIYRAWTIIINHPYHK